MICITSWADTLIPVSVIKDGFPLLGSGGWEGVSITQHCICQNQAAPLHWVECQWKSSFWIETSLSISWTKAKVKVRVLSVASEWILWEIHYCLILKQRHAWHSSRTLTSLLCAKCTQRGIDAHDKAATQSPGHRKPVLSLIPSNSLAFLHIFSGCYILKHLSEHIQTTVKYQSFDVNYILSEDSICPSLAHIFFCICGLQGLMGSYHSLVQKNVDWTVYLDFDTFTHMLMVYKQLFIFQCTFGYYVLE